MGLPNPTERRPWGEYQNLMEGDGFKIKIIEVRNGARNSLQRHSKRAEYWVVVKGLGQAEIGGREVRLSPGTMVSVPCGTAHRFSAEGGESLVILELQSGGECREDDIVRLEDDFGRVSE